ncbi:MAG: hypothetical protein CMI63_11740 [Parvularcula sp.]|nr:hypothetical protein [Parvularcula sp.]
MDIKAKHRSMPAAAFAVIFSLSTYAAAQSNECASEEAVAGWATTASLAPDESGDFLVGRWETRRDYSTHFGLRVAYDSSDGAAPVLKIWHNYKRGSFTMRLPDGRSFAVPVSANYAVTQANTPPEVIAYLRAAPMRIEFTTAGGKWKKYRTDGLPHAILAAEDALQRLKDEQGEEKCGARESWWRRFSGQ